MIINQLTKILDLYKVYGENFLSSSAFEEHFSVTKGNFEVPDLMLSLAYEAKDFGDSIELSGVSLVLKTYFDKAEEHVFDNSDSYSDFDIRKFMFSKSVFAKHFVFGSSKEYLKFYNECVALGYTPDKILEIFRYSFSQLRESILVTSEILSKYSSSFHTSNAMSFEINKISILLFAAVSKELDESYAMLEQLGDKDSSPNIDTSYVYIDQVENPDFFSTASKLLFEWCVKNGTKK